MLAGASAYAFSIPISVAIVILLTIVVLSYRQTIYEYPNGGGAYVVSRENLGELPSLTAGAALLLDYILTVSVSVAAGIEALTSAFHFLRGHQVILCLISIFFITIANLRGIRESAKIFSVPTYLFIFSIIIMIVYGLSMIFFGNVSPADHPVIDAQQPLTLFLILRAFSSGCTAMTGVEAVSNGVPIFRHPESKNASTTLIVMSVILCTMFLGITFLANFHGIAPSEHETVVSQLGRTIFGTGPTYYFLQLTTMSILILAANTSYNGFPRLASILAQDRYMPRQLATLGDKLVFSNGIIMLGILSGLLVILFQASTHHLIPLYAVGVFLSFSLSQAGMVIHWGKQRKKGWVKSSAINLVGCIATSIVMCIFVVTKFMQGAWVIIFLIPLLVGMFMKIKGHYMSINNQLSLLNAKPSDYAEKIKHTVILPVSGVHKGVVQALKYAQSIGDDVRAVYIEIDPAASEIFKNAWQVWGRGVPLVVLKSPYRSIVTPLLDYIEEVENISQDDIVTIVIPEFVTAKWWEQLLHNQTAFLIRAALIFRKGKVVTSVRYHLN